MRLGRIRNIRPVFNHGSGRAGFHQDIGHLIGSGSTGMNNQLNIIHKYTFLFVQRYGETFNAAQKFILPHIAAGGIHIAGKDVTHPVVHTDKGTILRKE